jgi:hypothetical protein
MTKILMAGTVAGLLLLSACGSNEAANNAAGPDINAAAGIPLGNDASAMEVVGNQSAGTVPLPAASEDNSAAPSSNRSSTAPRQRDRGDETNRSRSAPPPAEDVDDAPPGGDRGGNAAQGNLSGI